MVEGNSVETMQITTQITRSCLSCCHLKRWNYPATRDEPEDSGWVCGHEEYGEYIRPDPNCSFCKGSGFTDRDTGNPALPGAYDSVDCSCTDEPDDEDELAIVMAQHCPGYEFYDWSLEVEPEVPFEELSPEELQELALLEAEVQQKQYIERGWMTPEGELTPAFFEASDAAYDRR